MSIPNSKEIRNKQNEKDNLILQAAAGHYYNLAEILNYICWLLCVVSIVASFYDDEIIAKIIVCIMDTGVVLCGYLLNVFTKNAADLRNLFDYRVLLGSDKDISINEKKKLTQLSIVYSKRFMKKCQQQISNSGNDKPAGKKDWYVLAKDYEAPQAQIKCLEQNNLFNNKIMNTGYVIGILIHIVIISVGVLIIYFNPELLPTSGFINAVFVLGMRYVERIIQHIRYFKVSIQSETTLDNNMESPTNDGIKKCMQYLNEYRHIPVLGSSLIHRLKVKGITNLYQEVSKKDR